MNIWMKSAAATIALMAMAGPASAVSHLLDLTGTVSNGSFSNQTIGTTHYDQWVLALDGLVPFTVAEGDTIDVTVTLDQSFTIPASVQLTSFIFFLYGNSFPAVPTGSTGITQTFFDMGTPSATLCGDTTTNGQIAAGCIYPKEQPISFDMFTASFTVGTLSVPGDVEGAGLSYTLFSPAAVPEPASWALLIAGFATVGMAMRRRPSVTVAFA